jgi:D-lactate dehydrogenase
VKVHVFESEPWVKAAWTIVGTHFECVWIHGLLTPEKAGDHVDAEIISSDVSVLDAAALAPFKQLRFIALRSTGTDQVDLEYCRSRNIAVSNVPAYARNAVAEHVFALLLALSRHLCEAAERTRRLDFSWTGMQGIELRGKTLAVIGTGVIGRRVAMIARGFDMDVKAVDSFPDQQWAAVNKISYLPLDEALRRADVVSLHVPGMPETRHLLSVERFKLMKKGVVIINTARGDVVDSQALLEALASGKVAGAGLDVLPEENDLLEEDSRRGTLERGGDGCTTQLANHLLLQHPRVLVTPHCAFFTKEATSRLMQTTVANIEAFINGIPINIVT